MNRVAIALVALAGCGGDDGASNWTDNHHGSWAVIVNPTVNAIDQLGTPPLGTYREGVFARYQYYGSSEEFVEKNGIVWLPDTDIVPSSSGVDPTTLLTADEKTMATAEIPRVHGMAILPVAFRSDALELIGEHRVVYYWETGTANPPSWTITKHYSSEDINHYLAIDDAVLVFDAGEFPDGLVVTGKHVRVFTTAREDVTGDTVLGDLTITGEDAVIFGPTITGDLRINGPGASVMFTRVRGNVDISGPRAVLIRNQLCNGASARGGELRALENMGLAPLDDAGGGC